MNYKKSPWLALLLFVALLFSSCQPAPPPPPTAAPATAVTFTHDFEDTLTLEKPQRVASLLGSYAEAWQLAGGQLVGVTDDAVEERGLALEENVTLLGGTKSPSLETLLSLDPDFVILSADIPGHQDLYHTLTDMGIPAAGFRMNTFDDYQAMMKIFTRLTGREDLYKENVLQVQEDIASSLEKVPPGAAPTALYIRAFSSGYRAKGSDSLTGALLADLGAVNIADSDHRLLEDVSLEAIIAADPDFIFVTTMGSDDEKALSLLEEQLCSHPAWAQLSAVENGRFHLLPKDLFHYKPNARWGESYAYLVELLYE